MQDEKQFEQMMMQYEQLKNGAIDIAKMIESDDFDSAITMIKQREQLYLSCKCIRKYLDLTPVQKKQLDNILDELRELELKNLRTLEKGLEEVNLEIKKAQQSQKFQNAYENTADSSGSIVNVEE